MKREELIAYDKWLTRRKWGTGEIISPEQAADLYLAKHPLPPAEGAEEFLLAQRNGNDDPITVAISKEGWIYKMVVKAMQEFATLHAQRIAEKMVEEKCKKCKHKGLPNSIQEALNSGDGVYRP